MDRTDVCRLDAIRHAKYRATEEKISIVVYRSAEYPTRQESTFYVRANTDPSPPNSSIEYVALPPSTGE
jgi:hypothetical protein